jgi:putative membrane protein
MMSGFDMGFGGLGFLWMAIFWIGILAAAIWLLGNIFPRGNVNQSPPEAPDSAVEIVKQRYASGEISQEEYAKIRHDLEKSGAVRSTH